MFNSKLSLGLNIYRNNDFVLFNDESIRYDPGGFIAPHPYHLIHILKSFWRCQNQAVINTRQVSQIKNVVEL